MRSGQRFILGSRFVIMALAFILLILASCAKSAKAGVDGLMAERAESKSMVAGEMSFGLADMAVAPAAPSPSSPALPTETRKLVKIGSLNLENRDIAGAESEIGALVASLGGYVSSASNSVTSLSMVLRVPTAKFAEVMAGLKGAGKLKSRSESVEDVTLQYVDMASRIETKKILKERYTEYLKRAGKIEDLLSVERALNDVIAELDSMEASFKTLVDQIDYATVTVYVEVPPEANASVSRSFLGGLAKVWDGFIGFLYFLAYAVLILVLFCVPALLIVGLLYWLGFGKIGLVRKFFTRLSGKP